MELDGAPEEDHSRHKFPVGWNYLHSQLDCNADEPVDVDVGVGVDEVGEDDAEVVGAGVDMDRGDDAGAAGAGADDEDVAVGDAQYLPSAIAY